MHNKVREPLFHIVKRDTLPWYQAWGIRAVAIVLALLLCALITTLCTHLNPIKVFGTMFSGAFGSPRKIWILGQNLAILLCISLAVTPAFKMRFWNIGAEGQVLAGGLAAAACMICLGDKLPNGLLIVLIVWESPKGSGKVGIINQSTEAGWLPQIGGYKYLLTILVVAVLTVLVYVYLNYSKHGYEISVVGESERTARYVGIKVGKVIVRTMLLSGALCGIAGVLLVSGTDHTITTTIAGGQGFTAVMVSWLAKFNPISMILTSFLLVFLDRGAGEISTAFGLNQSFADILSGIIIFFIIGCEFFITYRLSFRKPAKKEAAEHVSFCVLYPPRHRTGYPAAVRQHRRNAHRKVRQPEPRHRGHHVCRRHQRRHRCVPV